MSRQPFLPKYEGYNYGIGMGALSHIPDFVVGIGNCVSHWSYVEHVMALLLGSLLGAESEASIAIFSNLRRSASQRELIEKAASYLLNNDAMTLLRALLAVSRSVERGRNEVVHGQWGHLTHPNATEKLPEPMAVWIASDDYASWNVKVLETSDDHAGLKDKMFVFTIRDIEEINERIADLWWMFFDFFVYVRQFLKNPSSPPAIEKQLARLINSSHVQEALRHQDRRQKTS